ncbi:MAG: DUF2188 domain-containing protein [Rikenellaceae bacterium]|nr:DUF2188 domain-containing protein [Rikenellaceae bacterium]
MSQKVSKNQYVAPRGDKWIAKGEGNKRATRVVETQKEAISIARQIAIKQHSELTIRGRNGQIRDKRSYGNDPYPPKG